MQVTTVQCPLLCVACSDAGLVLGHMGIVHHRESLLSSSGAIVVASRPRELQPKWRQKALLDEWSIEGRVFQYPTNILFLRQYGPRGDDGKLSSILQQSASVKLCSVLRGEHCVKSDGVLTNITLCIDHFPHWHCSNPPGTRLCLASSILILKALLLEDTMA